MIGFYYCIYILDTIVGPRPELPLRPGQVQRNNKGVEWVVQTEEERMIAND